jgi:gamma-glutamyl phosphate reductase
VVDIYGRGRSHRALTAKIREYIGQVSSSHKAVELLLMEKNIVPDFEDKVLTEVNEVVNRIDMATEYKFREDLTGECIFTIDSASTKDIDDAIEKAVWLEHGNRHSAHIHSKNVDNITKFGKAVDTAIFVKNAPSYAALGFGGEGYCTFTIASRTGEGLTSAATFTKRRHCIMADSLCVR